MKSLANNEQACPARRTGYAMMLLGIYLNIPFAALGMVFSYPEILRRPAGEILTRFAAGGPMLLAIWYAFVLAAMGMVVLSCMARRLGHPAAVAGAMAGSFQTIGLIRWVFVVPVLARTYTSSESTPTARETAVVVFDALHAYAGVAIGEHLGQLTTVAWVLLFASALRGAGHISRWHTHMAYFAAALIGAGLLEGFATVLDFDPGLLGLATPVGFVILSAWMVVAGITLVRRAARPSHFRESNRSNA